MSKKTIYFDSYCGYMTAAIAENGKLTEFKFEKKDQTSLIGNIYMGRVESVLPGMNAAFVNCGLERNCYLSGDDVYPDAGRYEVEGGEKPPFPDIKEGDIIAVQVVKAPISNKGARVTSCFSFVGKHMIYMPKSPFTGVSRKITDNELRKNLIYSANNMKSEEEGIVMRTAAPYAKRRTLEWELSYLRNLYAGVCAAIKNAEVGSLIYTEINLPMRIMRDTLSYDIEKIVVGNAQLDKLINDLVDLYPSTNRRPVICHKSGRDMMYDLGFAEQIAELTSPKVRLDNGAYLVIEHTEALTVIDVNTGKFTGDDSLEQTVYYTNILAAREIARQVRLRNIGGIVVVDFIDMEDPQHRKALVEELERALKSDSAKCAVSPMSKLGLVEFSRKRSGSSPHSVMTKPCPHCRGGLIKSTKYLLVGMRAKLLNIFADGNQTVRVDLKAEVAEKLADWKEFAEDMKAVYPRSELFAVGHKSYSEEQINYRYGADLVIPDNAVKIF